MRNQGAGRQPQQLQARAYREVAVLPERALITWRQGFQRGAGLIPAAARGRDAGAASGDAGVGAMLMPATPWVEPTWVQVATCALSATCLRPHTPQAHTHHLHLLTPCPVCTAPTPCTHPPHQHAAAGGPLVAPGICAKLQAGSADKLLRRPVLRQRAVAVGGKGAGAVDQLGRNILGPARPQWMEH